MFKLKLSQVIRSRFSRKLKANIKVFLLLLLSLLLVYFQLTKNIENSIEVCNINGKYFKVNAN